MLNFYLCYMLFTQLELPTAWRPLFRELSRMGWDLEAEHPEIPEWASRPPLVFSNRLGSYCYLCFFNLPVWCGNIRQKSGITIVGLSRQLPTTREEAEARSLPLEANWETRIGDFLAQSLN